jgi:hypothetical protein
MLTVKIVVSRGVIFTAIALLLNGPPPTLAQSGVTCTGNPEYCNAMLVCEGYSSREGKEGCMDSMYWSKIRQRNQDGGATKSPASTTGQPVMGGGCITVGGKSVPVGNRKSCP